MTTTASLTPPPRATSAIKQSLFWPIPSVWPAVCIGWSRPDLPRSYSCSEWHRLPHRPRARHCARPGGRHRRHPVGRKLHPVLSPCWTETSPQIDIHSRRDELCAIAKRGNAPPRHINRIWVSSKDRIVPPAAQHRAWADQAQRVIEIDAPHMPFQPGQDWQEWMS